jgi:hypothetical protein
LIFDVFTSLPLHKYKYKITNTSGTILFEKPESTLMLISPLFDQVGREAPYLFFSFVLTKNQYVQKYNKEVQGN